jgi:septum formation protein
MPGLVLASASEARRRMLEESGVTVEVMPARIDEDAIKGAMIAEEAPARDIADKLAEMKALRVSARCPGLLVLGADQVLVANDRIYDKPRDPAEARVHLAGLRGKTHRLLSAAVIARNGAPIWRHVGQAQLVMRPFTDAFLDGYLEAMGDTVTTTVGGYMLEGLGAQLFSRVQGDYFTVLGLPLLEILGFLRAQGVLVE